MAIVKPSEYPDWAVNTDGTDNDVVDPTSGQNNVVAPVAAKQLLGWAFKEKPPRNWFNWLARRSTQWMRWLDQETDFTSGSFTITLANTGATPATANWVKWGADERALVQLHIPGMTGNIIGSQPQFTGIPDAIQMVWSGVNPIFVTHVYNNSLVDMGYITPLSSKIWNLKISGIGGGTFPLAWTTGQPGGLPGGVTITYYTNPI